MTIAPARSLVPVLETERLILRGHTVGDFDTLAQMATLPEMVRFTTGKPSTREDSWWRLLRVFGHWHAWGFGFWVVEEKGDRALHRRDRLSRYEARDHAEP